MQKFEWIIFFCYYYYFIILNNLILPGIKKESEQFCLPVITDVLDGML